MTDQENGTPRVPSLDRMTALCAEVTATMPASFELRDARRVIPKLKALADELRHISDGMDECVLFLERELENLDKG